MEHNHLMTLEDETEVTYSDIIKNKDEEYINIYFETPSERFGFCDMKITYPEGVILNAKGYTEKEIKNLLSHFDKIGEIAFKCAKEKL